MPVAKFIFVTGGVVSGCQRYHCSFPRLSAENRGFKVTIGKLDPYINEPGTMVPFSTRGLRYRDGAETDLDLGHYERFIDENLTRASNVTAGTIYWTVITKERQEITLEDCTGNSPYHQ